MEKSGVNELFPVLLNLQEVLAKKIEIQKEIDSLPKAFEQKKEVFDKLNSDNEVLQEEINSINKNITSLRIRLDDAQREHEKFQMQASEIHNAREFEILNKDIEEAKVRESNLRNELKFNERKLKELENNFAEKEVLIESTKAELELMESELNTKIKEKEEELKLLVAKQDKFTPKLDATQLFKFERIVKNKSGVGIVAVHDVVCQGCHITLPKQFVNEVRKAESLQYCPYCSRILFYEDISEETNVIDSDSESVVDLTDGDEDFLV